MAMQTKTNHMLKFHFFITSGYLKGHRFFLVKGNVIKADFEAIEGEISAHFLDIPVKGEGPVANFHEIKFAVHDFERLTGGILDRHFCELWLHGVFQEVFDDEVLKINGYAGLELVGFDVIQSAIGYQS